MFPVIITEKNPPPPPAKKRYVISLSPILLFEALSLVTSPVLPCLVFSLGTSWFLKSSVELFLQDCLGRFKLGYDMGGVQNVWGEENVPKRAPSR